MVKFRQKVYLMVLYYGESHFASLDFRDFRDLMGKYVDFVIGTYLFKRHSSSGTPKGWSRNWRVGDKDVACRDGPGDNLLALGKSESTPNFEKK